ncbi:hypothetical protein MKW98_006928 [Papaver atlanticum]|uniref:Uncharacterized protein n=1 Tax=Papaver atlanticum TaxID=357466 RepID=A0AAD4XJ16_9MAGN|nr:hypothetical protein MKW98_006928 [Papaver atlanticum]
MAKDKNKFTKGRIISLRSNKSVLSQTVQSKRAVDKAKPARKGVKRKLGSGPCPNVLIRDLNDTFSDLEEQEFEDLQSKKVVEEEDIGIEIDVNADNDVEEEHMGMENDQRFIIDDYYKDYYVRKMGSLLKEVRSRTAGLVLGAFLLDEEKREERMAVIKPQNMTTREWEEFVKYVCSAEFKVKRLQMQIIRQKNTTQHTISRKGYARLEEEMPELNTKDEIRRVELWKDGHKQKQGKQPNIATQEALVPRRAWYRLWIIPER